jgi:chromosome segregation ATPase
MPEIISQSLELAKEHGLGPSGAIWLIILSLIAWAAGKSGIGAVKFVRGLLDTSTELREQIRKELSETRAESRLNGERLREQDRQIELQAGLIEELRRKLREADAYAASLIADLAAAHEREKRWREDRSA